MLRPHGFISLIVPISFVKKKKKEKKSMINVQHAFVTVQNP